MLKVLQTQYLLQILITNFCRNISSIGRFCERWCLILRILIIKLWLKSWSLLHLKRHISWINIGLLVCFLNLFHCLKLCQKGLLWYNALVIIVTTYTRNWFLSVLFKELLVDHYLFNVFINIKFFARISRSLWLLKI